jgi:hypothetical protein
MSATEWPIVPAPGDCGDGDWWNEDWQGKPKYSEKTCLSATLSTTKSHLRDPGSNPGRRGGKPATNRLSYGVAILNLLLKIDLKDNDNGLCHVPDITCNRRSSGSVAMDGWDFSLR